MNTPGLLKLRLIAARHRRTLIAVLVGLALVSTIGAGWAYANPGQTAETEHRHPQTVAGTVGTSTVVTGETSVYEQGTRLSDRRVYLLGATPNLTLDGQVDAPKDSEVHQRLVLQYRATRDDRVVWTETRVLAADRATRLQTTVNVSRIRERAERIQEEFGTAATVGLRLQYMVDYETDRYEGTLNSTVPLTFTQRAYIIDGDLAVEETRTTAVTVSHQQEPDYAFVWLLAGLGLLAVAGAAVLTLRGPLPILEADAEELQRQRYAEWISSGRIPVFSAEHRVKMESLADLINVAIDSNDRVLYDRDQDAYGVFRQGGTLFWYAPGQNGLSAASKTLNFDGQPSGTADAPTMGNFEAAFDEAEAGLNGEPRGEDEEVAVKAALDERSDGGENPLESGSEGDEVDG